ncbi:MAG: hypothetical protein HZB32_02320 [Nitrospirae bacterium]|nr:hypothetical protein [Nitrospirota bacterium]
MKKSTRFIFSFVFAAVFSISLAVVSMAGEKGGSPIKKMSKDQLIKLAMSAAPAEISNDATIMIPGEDGKLVEAKKGTNGFTCIPDVDGQSKPDPICFDQPTGQWVNDLMSGAPKPTNTAPGVSYMDQGGWRFEKDGKMLMKDEPGAKAVKEPPHWMIVWPFESKSAGLPSMPSKFGTYIMWEGTPYAHLMINQNLSKSK